MHRLKRCLIGGAAMLVVAAAVVLPLTTAMAGTAPLPLATASAVPLVPVRTTPASIPLGFGVQASQAAKLLVQPRLTVVLPAGPGVGYVSTVPFAFSMHKTTYDAESLSLVEIALTGTTLTLTATDLTPNGHVTWGGDCSFANANPRGRLIARTCTFKFDRDFSVQVYF